MSLEDGLQGMHAHPAGTKEGWEELHWDQDVGRWLGPRRDDLPRTKHLPHFQE
ncbi:MAG: hypothetical protein QOG31_986 [Thermoplasmata archaeon]|jgi:hypothetical protein|nr:hypothetical protein [Thermoplasmata archaeon]